MTDTEMRSKLNDVAKNIELRIAKTYSFAFNVGNQACYKVHDNKFMLITGLFWHHRTGVILGEYAFNINEARNNMFEDGEMFDIDEMTEDEIYDAIVKEIES